MKFPIGTTPPEEIGAFAFIFEKYGQLVPELHHMLRYFCHRYDEKSDVFSASVMGEAARDKKACELASWEPPKPMLSEDTHAPVGTYKQFLDVAAMWFMAYDNDEWEYIVSLDAMIHNCHKTMREPLPDDPEAKAKAIINVQKAAEGTRAAIDARKAAAKSLADSNDAMAMAILQGSKRFARASTSPESNLKTRG